MRKKSQWRYRYLVARRWKSYENNGEDEFYHLTFNLEVLDEWTAEHHAKKLAEQMCTGTNYSHRFDLKSVEQL